MPEPPSQPTPPQAGPTPPGKVITPSRIVAAVCLLIPFVAMLWVGSYTRLTPTFIGIPFFYWYQMAWVPITAGLTAIAYLVIRREEQARKQNRGGSA